MPIYRCAGKLLFFAHVPKCAGTAVENYLAERLGHPAFLQTSNFGLDPAKKWSKTTPQHMDSATFTMFFPEGFFEEVFAVVRHPAERMVSEYHYLKEVQHRVVPSLIDPDLTFSQWLPTLPGLLERDRFTHDNHLRPMSELVPGAAKIFKLETGLDAIVPWLDEFTGNSAGSRSVARMLERQSGSPKATPSIEDHRLLEEIFRVDYDRFGYLRRSRAS